MALEQKSYVYSSYKINSIEKLSQLDCINKENIELNQGFLMGFTHLKIKMKGKFKLKTKLTETKI